MKNTYVFMYSGQGSQYYNMGKCLFQRDSVFSGWMIHLDNIAVKLIGKSLLESLYDDHKTLNESYNRTLYTHQAIFMAEYSLTQVLLERGIEPDFVLGASLGEIIAATVSGVIDIDEAMELTISQAKALEACCEQGSMIAVLHDSQLYYEMPLMYENSELAAINYQSHFVISGARQSLKQIEKFLKSHDIVYQELPVTQGFHSSQIDPAAKTCKELLDQKEYQNTRIKYVSCLTGGLLASIPKDHFWSVVREPIQFPKAIQALENGQKRIYVDLGPSGTLANFTRYNLNVHSTSESHAIITPFHQELKQLKKIEAMI